MCTLIAFYRCSPGAHLWVAANRDEFHERPSEGPALRRWRGMPFLAPRDRRAGGTWWGLSRAGVFAALTNRPTTHPNPAARSRGHAVRDAMVHGTAEAAVREICATPAGTYNPFNLFVADANRAFAVVCEAEPVARRLDPGVWVIGNGDPNAANSPKLRHTLRRARSLLAPGAAGADPDPHPDLDWERELAALCRSHAAPAGGGAGGAGDVDPLASVCVHAGSYGTRCSTLLRLGPGGDLLRHAEGPPCTSPYRDLTPLLAELAAECGSPNTPTMRKAS